ncbi:ASCH domain-containing protein [Micromonospora sp. WMMD882]|uniref:ASCH domain-containing protein n=1 Tax=Micromonospora sp. WMMD882 TaxID=3015151 RepID=UPI00248C9AD9|nr:ASCH domain-containing protein [Micromonospora sp. WMMD882]WBB78235.1 ASCH domain-containing protein [Micromonospora sp. WMMD882]
MWPRIGDLRTLALGTPGEMRANLNTLVLNGVKKATAGLLSEYAAEGEELEHVGERLALVDDHDALLGLVEVTDVEVVRFADVSWEFARSEGEGDHDLDEWRSGHLRFWASEGSAVDDDTEIVCIRFRLVPSGDSTPGT